MTIVGRMLACAALVLVPAALVLAMGRSGGTDRGARIAQTDNFVADADSYVSSLPGETGANYGTALTLRVGGTIVGGSPGVYRTLVRFDSITSTIPADVVVDDATLRLNSLGSPSSLVIAARVVQGDWTEGGLTWANQPAAGAPESSRAVGTNPGVYDWNVTAQVQAWVNSDQVNRGFALMAVNESTTVFKTFRSREDTGSGPSPQNHVTLEVTWHRATPTATSTATATSRTTRTATRTTTATPTATQEPATATQTATPKERTPTPSASPSVTGETPTQTTTATDEPTVTPDTPTPTAETPTPESRTETPTPETPSPTEVTATVTPPAVATGQPSSLDIVLDTGCGRTYAAGTRANIIVTAVISRTARVSIDRFPGGVHVAELAVEPGGPPVSIPYQFRGPTGPRWLAADIIDDEGVHAVCRFDIAALPTLAPTPTAVVDGFVPRPTPDPGLYLPLAAKHGRPQGPGDLAVPPVDAKEGDVEWVSSLPHPRYLATALGNGANYRLSIFRLTSLGAPEWVSDGGIVQGQDIRVHRLSSGLGAPAGLDRLLVSAARKSGQLWLTTWYVTPGGSLQKLDTHGYGTRDVTVEAYALASRPVWSEDNLVRYQIVTPIRTASGEARVLSWSVNRETGALNGTDDTGDWQAISASSDLDVTRLPDAEVFLDPEIGFEEGESYDNDRLFAVTFRNSAGTLGQWVLQVLDSGGIGWFGGGESGVNVRNTASVAYGATTARVVPIGRSGFVSVRRDGGSDPDVLTWDYRPGGNALAPHRLGRSDWDTQPDDKGVALAQDDPNDASYIGSDVDGERAIVTDWEWEETSEGAGEIFVKTAQGKGAAGGIASVGKVMTLLVTLEAIQSGDVDLDDVVVVPAEAAEGSPAWMQPPLAEGDQVELETLLHGMMKRSSNGAARSIAYHVAGALYGNLGYADRIAAFVDDMNDRAAVLGLTDTLYCHPQGSTHSTPQDQVTLWQAISNKPLFWEFAGVNSYDPPCALDANDDPKCFGLLAKGNMSVPGLGAEKNGLKSINSGVGYSNGQLSCSALASGSTFDACRQCRIASVERLGRSFIGHTQQSDDSAGDVRDLLEYALLKRFTPDRRAEGTDKGFIAVGEDPTDFALAALSNEPPVSAVVTANAEVRVCTLNAGAHSGAVTPLVCLTRESPFLGPGGALAVDVEGSVEMVRLDALGEAEADVLTGHVELPFLRLAVWRIAPRDPTY